MKSLLASALAAGMLLALSSNPIAQLGRIEVQMPTIPARDVPLRVGTSAIKGRVVDGTSGAALARARVRIQGSGGRRPSVLTDGGGSFAFTNLPAGAYSLSVERATYLPARYPPSGRTLRAASRPFMLRDGEVLDAVTVQMFRGAAITGRVVDAQGEPVEFANVRILRVPSSGGRLSPGGGGGSSTNDLGEYRVPRLEPGRYLIMVMPRRTSPEETDFDAEPSQPPPQPLPTYYPGVAALDQAHPIAVDRGQTLAGLDIVLVEGLPSLVTGTVVSASGQPVGTGAYINARPILRDLPGFFDSGGASVRADGAFRLILAPGEYRLEARVTQPNPGVAPRAENEQFGSVRVSVASGGVESVSIVVGRGATASGRVIFDGTTPPPPNPGQVRLPLFAGDGGECRAGQAQVGADWTFRVEGLSGTCSAPPMVGFGGWTLKALLHDGQDLLDTPVTFETGQHLGDLQAVFTDRRTELMFRVADENGQPTREYVAVVFPASKSRWSQLSRNLRTYVPPPAELMMMLDSRAPAGRMTPPSVPSMPARPLMREAIAGLPAGDYYAVAVDDIEADATRDSSVLERLIPAAARVTLGDGAKVEVALRRVKVSEIVR